MKRKFEGQISENIPRDWDLMTKSNPLMSSELLLILKKSNINKFFMVTHSDYCCCEYKMKLNLLTFSKFKLNFNINVIALPVSICNCGYTGNLQSLINDYKNRKGIFLILNMDEKPDGINAAIGETLGNCIFENRFSSFDEYLYSMKSSYRRRINIAIKKASSLNWQSITNIDFTDEMYQLYRNVFNKSNYPLECLEVDFFRLYPGEIFCLYEKSTPLAFVLLSSENNRLSFVFGGMDYKKRDTYDLYMNMLIFIINQCISRKIHFADLGQTAENSKMRVGAKIFPRYLCIFSNNFVVTAILKKAIKIFSYKHNRLSHSVWKINTVSQN